MGKRPRFPKAICSRQHGSASARYTRRRRAAFAPRMPFGWFPSMFCRAASVVLLSEALAQQKEPEDPSSSLWLKEEKEGFGGTGFLDGFVRFLVFF